MLLNLDNVTTKIVYNITDINVNLLCKIIKTNISSGKSFSQHTNMMKIDAGVILQFSQLLKPFHLRNPMSIRRRIDF